MVKVKKGVFATTSVLLTGAGSAFATASIFMYHYFTVSAAYKASVCFLLLVSVVVTAANFCTRLRFKFLFCLLLYSVHACILYLLIRCPKNANNEEIVRKLYTKASDRYRGAC